MSPGSESAAPSSFAGGPPSSSAASSPASSHHPLFINTNTMGQSFAKSNPSLTPSGPPPSPSVSNSRGFTAAVAGGLRLTRAFGKGRKKSEDVSKVMDRSVSHSEASSSNYAQRIEATASISSSPAQLATQTLKKAASKPQQHGQPPPLPPKPQHVSSQSPSHPLSLQPGRQPSRSPLPEPSANLRSSIIPISPGISSAVTYIRMEDGSAIQDQDRAQVEATIPQSLKAGSKGKQREQEDQAADRSDRRNDEQGTDTEKGVVLDKGEMKESWRKSDSTMSHHTIRPGGQPSRPVSMTESLHSTHTIVPVKRQSALITDADFGMPEEEDDADGSVEAGNIEPLPQNDPDLSPTALMRVRERRTMSLTINNSNMSVNHQLPPTPSSASAAHLTFVNAPEQPRSTPSTLSRGTSPSSYVRTQLASFSTQPQGQPYLHLSTGPPHRQQTRSASPSPIQQSRAAPHNPYTTFPSPLEGQPRPTSRLDRSLPALPPHAQPQHLSSQPQPRQPTLSMSGGFGLAKRAVEKMGFGRFGLGSSNSSHGHGHGGNSQTSGYSSSTSSSGHTNYSNTPPSSYGSHPQDVSCKHGHGHGPTGMYDGLAAPRKSTSSNSGQSSHGSGSGAGAGGGGGGYLHRKKKHAPGSASISSTHSNSTSTSDSDAMDAPSGPNFGKRVRGPLRRGDASGVVFGRDLKSVVRETAVGVGVGGVPGGKPKGWAERWRNWDSSTTSLPTGEEYDGDREKGGTWDAQVTRTRKGSLRKGQLKALEERRLPALVVRCAQHLLIWGIQEEGLFRIPGRALHVTRLRGAFDSGADFDMTECSPGDLDPHAVASVFKAFLRELPQPILTSTLSPYFEAAMAQENSANADKEAEAAGTDKTSQNVPRGPGLPSGPRNTGALPFIRKAPSLSTLAMPSMSGIRPPSKQLVNAIQTLLAQLPEENRDLLRTVTELMSAVALDHRETKMPLSNLLLVFCPSLNLSPMLLRVICDTVGIWDPPKPEEEDLEEDDIVLDIRREEVGDETYYEDARDGTEEDRESIGRMSEDLQSSVGYNASVEDVLEASRVSSPVKPEVHIRKPSFTASSINDGSSYMSTSEDHGNLPSHSYSDIHSQSVSPPPLSLSAESLDTPDTSSHDESNPHLPIRNDGIKVSQKGTSPIIVESMATELLSSTTPRRPVISSPVLISGPVEFPSVAENGPAHSNKLGKRRSIPILSLPNLSLKASTSSDSPSSSTSSLKRMTKPSLQRLFQKKSSSSLSSPKAASPAQSLRPVISSPYLQSRSASDSSVSTPLTAVTAPQGSTTTLPPSSPKLETSIEGSSLHFGSGLGLELDVPPPPPMSAPSPSLSSISAAAQIVRPGSTPIANMYHRAVSPSPSVGLITMRSQSSLSISAGYASSPALSHLRPNLTSRSRGLSTSSSASSNHLGLLEDVEQEDWSRSVLLAAEVNDG